ncbi:DUF2142 domain-containing protein [Agrilutibacter solisilvae]|uniref:DUF2142 domain-containing protein n=1 Tax=Agrilutibacter solisilvae TaxID=2763317 RepID=A0A974Y1F0_9GAMM|nr:DUF2142 domain-containing protein [Lysobacter solisilvae]QSX79652.1 DUF2142 domain-containing protein [Lysobacter solisilvae]
MTHGRTDTLARRRLPAIVARVALAVVAIVLLALALPRRSVELTFQAQASTAGRLQLFHDADGAYSEYASQWFALSPGAPRPQALAIAGDDARHLRVDPPATAATRLCALRVDGQAAQFTQVHAGELDVRREGDCLVLAPHAQARDPQLILRLEGASAAQVKRAARWQRIFVAGSLLLVLAVVFALWRRRAALGARLRAWPAVPALAVLDRRAHWLCAALMLAFGLGHAVLTPPGAVADEEAHLAKVIRIAGGFAFGDSGDAPMPDPRRMYGPFKDYTVNKAPFTAAQLAAQRAQPLQCTAVAGTRLAKGANGYFPHHYALPTLAWVGGCAAGLSFGGFLLLARLLNLLLAVALVAWGVARARRGKWALVLVALLPMSLFQMASLSADALTLSLTLAWLGLVSGLAGGGISVARAQGPLWLLSLSIALLKPGAAWILAALLFCRPAYAREPRAFALDLVKFVALPWVIHAAWILAAVGDAPVLAGVDPKANLALLTAHPFAFPRQLLNAFSGGEGLLLWQRLIGVLGWLDVRLSPWAYWAGTGAVLAAVWSHPADAPPRPREVAPLACLFALGATAVLALPLFLYWTPTGAPAVLGLQGRYFLPTLAFLLTWCGLRSPDRLRAACIALILLAVVALNVDALLRLHDAYFVTGRVP